MKAGRAATWLTTTSIAGLVLGFALGAAGHLMGGTLIPTLSAWVQPLGDLWIRALQMTVIPLVITQLLAALIGEGGARRLSGIGGRAVVVFTALWAGAGLITFLVTPPSLSLYEVPSDLLASLALAPAADIAVSGLPEGTLTTWFTNLFPSNVFESLVSGDLLSILIFVSLFGLALGQLPPDKLKPVAATAGTLADAMMVVVGWILWGAPIGVFALVLGFALESGFDIAGFLLASVVVKSGVLFLVTLAVYPVSVLVGRVGLAAFTRAAAPAQLVAVSTRSSLASLPALIEGGRRHLGLSSELTGFVFPLCVSIFKLNQAVSPLVGFMFLAHVFGIPLGLGEILGFWVYGLLMGLAEPGIPQGTGGARFYPLYVAVGIPLPAAVIVDAVDAIPDVFMTLINVTGDMAVAAILSRTPEEDPARALAHSSEGP